MHIEKQKREIQKSMDSIKEHNSKLGFIDSNTVTTKNVIYTNHKMKAQISVSETSLRKSTTFGTSTNEKTIIYYNKLYNDPQLKKLYDSWKQQRERERIRIMYKMPKQEKKTPVKNLKTQSAPTSPNPDSVRPQTPKPEPPPPDQRKSLKAIHFN